MPGATAPTTASVTNRSIVCVGFAEWDTELWTNQHHLMARLARDNRVLFIESLGLRKPQLGTGRDVTRIVKRLRAGLRGPRKVKTDWGELHVLSPLVLPYGYALGRRLNGRLLPALVRRAAKAAGLGPRPVLWAYVPQAEVLVDMLEPERVVYHCVDDIAAQDGIDGPSFRAAEARFAGRADLVLASAPALAERMRTLSDHVLYAPNVADTALFAEALEDGPVDLALEALPSPRIVFTGAVAAKKLDLVLLADLARARPDWSVVLVGPVGLGDPGTDVSALTREANVHLLGPRRYEELPAVLRGADAALIPYRRTQLTASVFPMKVHEYLAAGLPVVATPLEALRDLDPELVAVAVDGAATARALDALLAADTPERRRARSAAAAAHSWDTRLAEIGAAL